MVIGVVFQEQKPEKQDPDLNLRNETELNQISMRSSLMSHLQQTDKEKNPYSMTLSPDSRSATGCQGQQTFLHPTRLLAVRQVWKMPSLLLKGSPYHGGGMSISIDQDVPGYNPYVKTATNKARLTPPIHRQL